MKFVYIFYFCWVHFGYFITHSNSTRASWPISGLSVNNGVDQRLLFPLKTHLQSYKVNYGHFEEGCCEPLRLLQTPLQPPYRAVAVFQMSRQSTQIPPPLTSMLMIFSRLGGHVQATPGQAKITPDFISNIYFLSLYLIWQN